MVQACKEIIVKFGQIERLRLTRRDERAGASRASRDPSVLIKEERRGRERTENGDIGREKASHLHEEAAERHGLVH